jgi:hypothetical protein
MISPIVQRVMPRSSVRRLPRESLIKTARTAETTQPRFQDPIVRPVRVSADLTVFYAAGRKVFLMSENIPVTHALWNEDELTMSA